MLCVKCGEDRRPSEFYPSSRSVRGLDSSCRECVKSRVREFYEKHRNRIREKVRDRKKRDPDTAIARKKAYQIKHRYGISVEDYKNLINSQDNACGICSTSFVDTRPEIDHCHRTERVRGLLCKDCNTALGRFKDSIPSLIKSVQYLRKYSLPKEEPSAKQP